jgi:hypothetical protein
MLGSTKFTEGTHAEMKPGVNAVYVVTDDVDGVYAELGPRAGGSQTSCATPNTAHSFTARDPEGNLWTFGTYRGAP